jgi:hypothetical protein
MAVNLVNRVNGSAAWQVAYHPPVVAVVGLGLRRDGKSKNGEGGEGDEDVFHGVDLGYRAFDAAPFRLFETSQNSDELHREGFSTGPVGFFD